MELIVLTLIFGVLFVYREHQHAEQLDALVVRIQAPERAQITDLGDPGKQFVSLDDDADFFAAKEDEG